MGRFASPRWLGVLSRVAAAALGGYGLACAAAAACAVTLPLPRSEAVLAGMMLGFAVQAAAAVWVFAARSAGRAWAGLLVPASVLSAVLLVHAAGAAR